MALVASPFSKKPLPLVISWVNLSSVFFEQAGINPTIASRQTQKIILEGRWSMRRQI
jgi:hypothetical protein